MKRKEPKKKENTDCEKTLQIIYLIIGILSGLIKLIEFILKITKS